jgi:DnaJ-class molecular chaperone with C-terminal Zn finger domain
MVGAFLAGVGLLLLLGLLARWFTIVEPRRLLTLATWLLIVLVGLIAVALVATGRGSFLVWLLLFFLPVLLPRLRRTFQAAATRTRVGGGQSSTLSTRTLRMALDHDTGDLDGEVISGPYCGRRLSDMTLADVLEMMRACAVSDNQSLPLLEAFADRRFPGWRGAAGEEGQGPGPDAEDAPAFEPDPARMTRDDAYRVLGLSPAASDDDVRAAYLRLIKVLHPDQGGSGALAAQVNRARDLLLGRDPSH